MQRGHEDMDMDWAGPEGKRAFDLEKLDAEGMVFQIWRLAPNLVLSRAEGHMKVAHAEFLTQYLERLTDEAPLYIFHDWSRMTGYETRCRQMLTEWTQQNRAAIGQIHLLIRSKIVAMGVSVANLALGGMMHAYSSAGPFEQQLRQLLERIQPA